MSLDNPRTFFRQESFYSIGHACTYKAIRKQHLLMEEPVRFNTINYDLFEQSLAYNGVVDYLENLTHYKIHGD